MGSLSITINSVFIWRDTIDGPGASTVGLSWEVVASVEFLLKIFVLFLKSFQVTIQVANFMVGLMRFNSLLRSAAEDLGACHSKSSYAYKYPVQLTINHVRSTSTKVSSSCPRGFSCSWYENLWPQSVVQYFFFLVFSCF